MTTNLPPILAEAYAERARALRELRDEDQASNTSGKVCSKCQKKKDRWQFGRNARFSDGLNTQCHTCVRQKSIDRRQQKGSKNA